MEPKEPSANDAGRRLNILISFERAAELNQLAADLNKDPNDLAKEFLEAEIEAHHGLRRGPWLRRYMYR